MLGFLSPEGKFFPCKYYGHLDLAGELLRSHYGISQYNEIEKLCDLGWCIIQDGFVGFTGWHNEIYTAPQEEWFLEHYDKMDLAQQIAYDTTKELSDLIKEENYDSR